MDDYLLDLEVDVNGEEVFMVNKEIISCYSGRISKLLSKSKGVTCNRKVIFHDFPGGASNFELVTRFCYSKGKININPFNISNLTCSSQFMEMNNPISGSENLCEKIEKSLEEIKYWSWSELLVALKQAQKLLPFSSSLTILDKLLDSLIIRIASSCETSPCPSISSSDASGFRLSCDTRSTESLKNQSFRATWWVEDLVALNIDIIEILVKLMVSRNFDNGVISRFLFHYQKLKYTSTSMDEKFKIIEKVVEMLYSLDISYISHKSLFGMLRVVSKMNVSSICRENLEGMIGSQLDRASLDNLLVPSPIGTRYLYDVDLVHRLLKAFIGKGVCCVPLSRLKKVSSLLDLYLAEVAPDPNLKGSKFLALITALPDSARDSCDGVYHAVNLYLEVHSGLSEEQKTKVCLGLNYEKLSSRAFNHLAQNTNFPSKSAVQALVSQQRKLKSLLQDTNEATFSDFSPCTSFKEKKGDGAPEKQIVLYAKKVNFTDENDKLKSHLQGMQWRVLELEKVCSKMQIQMTKMMRARLSSQSNAKNVPKLCS